MASKPAAAEPIWYGPEGNSEQETTLADFAYEQLHNEIVMGRLRPNSLLLEGDIATRLDVSRTPVRESLQRLAKDGLVVSRRRRWFVVEPSLDDISDIYDVRTALEAYAARLASERATAQQLAAIEAALEQRGHARSAVEDFASSNERFHRAIVEASGSTRLVEAAQRSKHFYFNARVAQLYRPDDLAESQRQHEMLFVAIRKGDGDGADRITRQHIAAALAIIRSRWVT